MGLGLSHNITNAGSKRMYKVRAKIIKGSAGILPPPFLQPGVCQLLSGMGCFTGGLLQSCKSLLLIQVGFISTAIV